ncbi:uncharacterized protein LOC123214586 isoform X1 [Mangifera indica]|uniref:uncharacterized protein LOC123214586 isoform X1 n=1 Tax=Mangifera indica TaxID=29780 RepID=UPI001CFACB7F|nr:uncharacterized protein LOC123214586 isoform X1 [Mangifera indica]
MERSEPALVPEWLKNSGTVTGGGRASQPFGSQNLYPDGHFVSKHERNKSSLSSDYDIGPTVASGLGDQQHYELPDSLGSILLSRFKKEKLQGSLPMTGKQGDMWPRKVASHLTNSNRSSYTNGNGFFNRSTVVSNVDKIAFERDFPSLGVKERQGGPEIGRVSSPGLSTAIQRAQTIGGDVWTSALAEVPVIMGNNTTTSMQQNVSVTSASVFPALSVGLNMAETLVQGPSRAQTLPQLSVGTHRLEELAIKQSRQLIPMTPSMPKTLVVSPSEKSKAKVVPQQQHHPLHTINHIHGGAVRSDNPKTYNEARLCVLKPSRELNSVSLTTKNCLSPTDVSKVVISPHGTSSPSGSALLRSSGNSPKSSSGPLCVTIEKRPSQAQSRNDFFNLLKKKSSTNSTSAVPDFSVSEKSGEIVTEDAGESVPVKVGDAPSSDSSPLSTNNGGGISHDDSAYVGSWVCLGNGEKHSSPDMVLDPDEEEAAFLRSLGWEENAGEDEGLTEEEISSFVKEYMKLRPSSKLPHGMLANHAI